MVLWAMVLSHVLKLYFYTNNNLFCVDMVLWSRVFEPCVDNGAVVSGFLSHT